MFFKLLSSLNKGNYQPPTQCTTAQQPTQPQWYITSPQGLV